MRAPDLAAHKTQPLRLRLAEKKKSKAHIIRTVLYVWISPRPFSSELNYWKTLPSPLFRFLNTAAYL